MDIKITLELMEKDLLDLFRSKYKHPCGTKNRDKNKIIRKLI